MRSKSQAMAMRYFKRLGSATDVVLDNGARVKFTTLDNLLGWYADTNDYVHGQFEKMMREGRYGISEVSAEEFVSEYVDKKKEKPTATLKPVWREEMGKGALKSLSPIQALGSEKVAAVVGVSNPAPPSPTPVTVQQVQVAEALPAGPKTEFKPTVGKRKSKPTEFTRGGLAVPPAGT